MEVKRVKDWIKEVDWIGSVPFILMHLSVLLTFWTGVTPAAVAICIFGVFFRLFGITGGYHRYFSHRTYQTSRFFQFILALIGASSTQMGPLWWSANHRHHHRHSDQEPDIHSPIIDTFLWSHIGWIMARPKQKLEDFFAKVPDLAKYPELRWLDRHHNAAALLYLFFVAGIGYMVEIKMPQLHTTMAQFIVWGFFVSTVMLYHVTFSINSLTHLWGTRRYKTNDDSRNNFLLGVLIMGEGWHNNHHKYAGSVRQGFYWWEIDVTYYILKTLSWFHIVWDLRAPPKQAYDKQFHDQAQVESESEAESTAVH